MLRKKTTISIVMAVVIIISCTFTSLASVVEYGAELTNAPSKSYSQKFSDVTKSHWAFKYIAEMNERGVLSGYPNGYFYPERNVSRGEFAKIMTLAAGLSISNSALSSYADVDDDDWYCPYIETARYYLSGYTSDGKNYYMPESNALREDIAVALVKLKGYDTTGYDLSILQAMFDDWRSISSGAQKYVAVAVEKGLISGYDDNTFRGQAGITRAETATLLWRAYQYGNGNKDFEQEVLEKEELPTPTPSPIQTTKPSNENNTRPEPTPTPATNPVVNTDNEKDTEIEEPTPTPEPTPEPKKYGWKVSTVKASINEPEVMVTVPNGIAYMSGNKIYNVTDDGSSTTIYDFDNLKYTGETDISSSATVKNDLISFDYNKGEYYAVLTQEVRDKSFNEKECIFYNVTKNEVICYLPSYDFEINSGTLSSIIYFYSNGDYGICGKYKVTYNGNVIDYSKKTGKSLSNRYLLLDNDLYYIVTNGCIWIYDIENGVFQDKFNNQIRAYCPRPSADPIIHSTIIGKNYIYSYNDKDNEIIKTSGDADVFFFLSFDDIQNDESRYIENNDVVQYGAIRDDESAIYFYDTSYGSLRKIEKQ